MSTAKKTAKPAEKTAAEAQLTVTARTRCLLNLRAKPCMDAEILGVLEKNTTLQVLDVHGEWAELKKGWVKAEFIEVLRNAEPGKA